MTANLDGVDWAIIAELQTDARISVSELARRVNLGSSATAERLRRLESGGVITGYRVVIDPAAVGYPVLAIVRLKYPGSRHDRLHQILAECREILECVRTTGEDCYTLKVVATSMPHLERVVDQLAALGSTTTNVVYSETLPLRGPTRPPVSP
ncbi:Lrp/AsnC family transcriptional regulator [Nocardioides sp. CER19]|uniref:Lrp/AsnC family transcriptional regulator n=1 Tax=Nocardioides sp. CER19 TaxID=3038538 RepID=UPI002449FBB6|nr:Lrp/AsnC family transcriptional regulator [Nocardioides sp. CER19]MDH2415239.1 Lrp/AsnC family transcriptional regulator [Nocardioides sp. CER19]